MSEIHQARLDCGLWLVAERIASAQSAAMTLLTPCGVWREPADRLGVATVLSEMMFRGAGELDARAHSEALDRLGVQRGVSVDSLHLRLSATMLGARLGEALPLILAMVRRPWLAEDALEPSRELALQGLESLEDEPQQKAFIRLRQQHYPAPFNRCPMGEREHLEQLTLADVRQFWQQGMKPDGAILGVAGRFEWSALRAQVEAIAADWHGTAPEPVLDHSVAPRGYAHDVAQTTQVHIGVAFDTVAETHPDAMLQRAAVAVLSGGMSGRLFTEVREREGLCYSVHATYVSNRHMGVMLSYAGTTEPRAQRTLDVLTRELRRIAAGVEEAEFARAIVGMKSRLVMQGESTAARAAALAFDQHTFGRPRSLDEIAGQVDAVRLAEVNRFVAERAPASMTIVTIGPQPLKVATSVLP